MRDFLPEVAVPEVPDDSAYFASCLFEAGYFEAVSFTGEDLQRTAQYQANAQRAALMESTDMNEFLRSLAMMMTVAPFDDIGRARVAQLINKSNQFNLTTRRYTDAQVSAMASDPSLITMQVRLADKLGDNGMISVLIARPAKHQPTGLLIDTWLMSCRVLGRGVESEVLNVLVEKARERGFGTLYGEYLPTAKNALVKDHYKKLGFTEAENRTFWSLNLATYQPISTFIKQEKPHALADQR